MNGIPRVGPAAVNGDYLPRQRKESTMAQIRILTGFCRHKGVLALPLGMPLIVVLSAYCYLKGHINFNQAGLSLMLYAGLVLAVLLRAPGESKPDEQD